MTPQDIKYAEYIDCMFWSIYIYFMVRIVYRVWISRARGNP
jgi:hypothetical protein